MHKHYLDWPHRPLDMGLDKPPEVQQVEAAGQVEISRIRPSKRLGVLDVADRMKSILRRGIVEPLQVGEDWVTGDSETYWALYYIGVDRVPTAEPARLEDLGLYSIFEQERNGMKIATSLEELFLANIPTPLYKLEEIAGTPVWAKLEWFNPLSSSIKDRPALFMFTKYIEEYGIPEKLYESTSSNTGIALAALAAAYRVRARLYIPSLAGLASETVMKLLGAEVRRMQGATVDYLDKVLEEAKKDQATVLNQFDNDINFASHIWTTAKEIELQTKEAGIRRPLIIAAAGTSGHSAAISLYIKNRMPGSRSTVVEPEPGEYIPGIRRLETGSKWATIAEYDLTLEARQEEAAKAVAEIARSTGLLVGLSSGAVYSKIQQALQHANQNNWNIDAVIAVFPDNIYKYIGLIATHV